MKNKKISKGLLIKELLELHKKIGRRPQKRDNDSLYSYSRKIFGSWNKMMEFVGYKVRYYQKVKIPTLNEDFAYFLGLLITDGHIQFDKQKKKYNITLYTSFPEEKLIVEKLIKKLFEYNASYRSRFYGFNKKPNYEIRISSKMLVGVLVNEYKIPYGAKSLNVRIPKIIISSKKSIKESFIRGIIDGDGSITKYTLKIASGSINFLKDLKKVFESININSGKIFKDKTCYILRIYNKYNLSKIKKMYSSGYFYLRKKEQIDKI